MPLGEILAVALFVGVIATLMLGFPVAFTLPGTALLFALALLFAIFPRALAYPLIALGVWAGAALLVRGYRLRRDRARPPVDRRDPGSQ